MLFDKQSIDDAVSPVVGVILMVAVTVILAAVIGSFVLDLGNNVQANPQAGVAFDQQPDNGDAPSGVNMDADSNGAIVTVQVISMENADHIEVYGSSSISGDNTDANGDGNSRELTAVGQTAYVENVASGDKVTIKGSLDGKEAVLQTYAVE